jgi:pilus assembly protein Flp/PilA
MTKTLLQLFAVYATSSRGATAVEYGLICGLIVVALLVGLNSFAGATTSMYSDIESAIVNSKTT